MTEDPRFVFFEPAKYFENVANPLIEELCFGVHNSM